MLNPTGASHRRIHSANVFQFSRPSIYKNIYGQEQKKELQFTNLSKINKAACSAESTVISCNQKFFALPFGTYGSVIIMKHSNIAEDSKVRRANANPPLLSEHSGLVHDHSFSPFLPSSGGTSDDDTHLFSTCSADCTVKIWKIKEKEQTIHGHCEDLQQVVTLKGHDKKVNTGDFHPSVNNIFVSASGDNTLRIWDITTQKDMIVLRDDFDDMVQSWDWSATSSVLYTSNRDTVARVYDPRTKYAIVSGKAHDGKKGFRVVCTNHDQFFTVGFNGSGTREFALWDLRKGMRKGPLTRETINDMTPTQLFPFYDSSSHLLYLAGKGDTKMRVYEIDSNSEPYVHYLSEFKLTTTNTGLAMLPKRLCDTKSFEVARFMKLNVESVETFNFFVPRKKEQSDIFQEDLYPPVPSGKPSNLTPSDWFGGKSCIQDVISLRPQEQETSPTVSIKSSRGRSYALKSAPSVDNGLNNKISDEFSDSLLINSYGFYLNSYLNIWLHKEMKWKRFFFALHKTKNNSDSNSVIIYGETPSQVKTIRDEIANKDSNLNRNEFISKYSRSKNSGVIFLHQLVYMHKAYNLGDEKFSDNQTIEVLYSDIVLNENVTVYLSSDSEETVKSWVETIMKLCKKKDIVKNNKTFKGYVLLLKEHEDDIPAYWAKRWICITEDYILLYANRKANIPESGLKFSSRKGSTPFFDAISHYKIYENIDSCQFCDSMALNGDEKNLCFTFKFEVKSKKDRNLLYFLANDDQQKESIFEMIGINSGAIKVGASEEEKLLGKLGLVANEEPEKIEESFTPVDEEIGKIQVWPISSSIANEDIEDLFSVFGKIDNTFIDPKEGYALVTYHQKSSALAAVVLNQSTFDANKINVQVLSDEEIYEPGFVKIDNLSPQCAKQDLRDLFGTFGTIQKIKLWRDQNKSTKFSGFIKFKTKEQAEMALMFNGSKLYYEEIKVSLVTSENELASYNQGDEKGFVNEYDPNEVKAGRQKVLIQIKGDKKIRSRKVELSPKSINSGDIFVLDCGATIYVWNGKQTSRFKKARGLDVATNLKLKERGGNAKILIMDEGKEDEKELERQFWNSIFSEYKDPLFKKEDFLKDIPDKKAGGDDKEFEEYIDKKTILFRIGFTEHKFDMTADPKRQDEYGKYQLKIVHKGGQPALKGFNSNFVYVLDCWSEIYIWEGKFSSKQQRSFGRKFASKLEQQDKRPIWTSVCKIVEHSEPILFKEKMSDYAGALPIAVSSAALEEKQGKGNIAAKREQHEIDVDQMLNATIAPKEAMFHDDSLTDQNEVYIWRVEGFEKVEFDSKLYGQLFSGDSFVILFKYMKFNKVKHIIYFWQGRDCSTNEKGASALLTIDVSNINLQGGDAPQIRIVQQKETRHFLSIFHSYLGLHSLIINTGKSIATVSETLPIKKRVGGVVAASSSNNEDSNKKGFQQALENLIIYDIRCVKSPIADNDKFEKTKAIQVDLTPNDFRNVEQLSRLFNSNHCLLVCTKDKKECYLWKGKYHNQKELELAAHIALDVLKLPSKLISVDEGAEKDTLWKLFGLTGLSAAPIKKYLKTQSDNLKKRIIPKLYQFSGATGVVDVERIYNYSQDDLDIFGVFFIDAQEAGCFVWFGSYSQHHVQKVALETAMRYCVKHYNNGEMLLQVTHTGQEPSTFKTLFHAWSSYRDKYIINYISNNPNIANKEVSLPAMEMIKEYARKTYSYKTLLSEQLPPGVDATKLEEYLNNEEFQMVFNMTREEFTNLSKWKQESEKRKVYLF